MVLEDSITVAAPPSVVFRFFDEMERHYLAWHPDHLSFQWEQGNGVREGNVFRFEERIAGKLLKKRVRFTRVVTGAHLEFAPTFMLMRLFLPRILFRLEAARDGTRVIAQLHLRLGPLARRLNRKELAAVRDHMRVEGINMKRIVEQEWSCA